MNKIRSTLWFMLFTGVIVHMLCCTSLYIALTYMAKPDRNSNTNETTTVALCVKNAIDAENYNSTLSPLDHSANITRGEFEWTSDEVNVLRSSFTWFMGPAQLLGGMMCQRYGGKITFTLSNLIMAVVSLMIPFGAGLGIKVLIMLRVLQGIFGGAAIGNSANMLISKWVPPNERGKFSTVMAGLYTGTAFSYFLHGWVIHLLGWRAVFYVTSAIATMWCVAWHFIIYDSPQEHPYISPEEVKYIEKEIGNSISKKKLPIPWRAILTSTPIIVNTLCQFASMWTIFTFTLYIPAYLTEIHGFAAHKMGMLSSLPYILETLFAIVFGYLTDFLLHRHILSRTNTRKFAAFFNTIIAGSMFAALAFGGCNSVYILSLLTLAVMLHGASLSGIAPNVIDLSPNFCAILHGIQGFITSSAGYLSPLVITLIAHKGRGIREWNMVFVIIGCINIVPGILFMIFSQSEVQPWNYATQQTDVEKPDKKLLKNHENGNKMIFK
ncbi:vesicular glutamate transporter 1-like [Planococcus citri]|uniref:vesicular glutamate transporter 1-like n=1 Tax=Planococcus citri TaxID=170843 RepID=UPI0031F88D5C